MAGLVAMLLTLTALGCGAAGSAPRTTTAAQRLPAPSASAFAARADAVCDHAAQRIGKLARGQSVGVTTLVAAIGVERTAVELLAAIDAPRGMRAPYARLRSAIARRAELRRRFLVAFRTSGHMSPELIDRANAETVKANRLAEQLSLKDCPPF